MATLYTFRYNNYYNRILKIGNSISDYGNPVSITERTNFNPNDGITAVHVVNSYLNPIPDYCIVADENGIIESRWYIIDCSRVRAGQYKLNLLRDVIADYKESILNSTAFIEKGYVPSSSPLIFNREDMSYNEIKTRETLINDKTKCPWLCIYAASKDGEAVITYKIKTDENLPYVRTYDSQDEFEQSDIFLYKDQRILGNYLSINYIRTRAGYFSVQNGQKYYSYSNTKRIAGVQTPVNSYEPYSYLPLKENYLYLTQYTEKWDSLEEGVRKQYNYNQVLYDEYQELNGQVIRVRQADGSYKYYKISISELSSLSETVTVEKFSMSTPIEAAFLSVVKDIVTSAGTGNLRNCIEFDFISQYLVASISEMISDQLNGEITDIRYHLTDAPYDMFCIPYSDELKIKNSLDSNFVEITANKTVALRVARDLIETYSGAGSIYDAQILPYCPILYSIVTEENGKPVMDLNTATISGSNRSFSSIKDVNNKIVGYIIHASSSSFSRQINLEDPIEIQDYKVENECDLYRLCSPNYNGVFEFKAAKNGGIQSFRIQCTYKPYSPYIKVFPNWGRLYGKNFGTDDFDARGLICGGDFSLPMTTDQWTTYELQNKNYQNSFDRQIQNIETNNAIERTRENWEIGLGATSAALSTMLSMMGSGAGGGAAAMGSLISGGLSLFGGIVDKRLNERQRAENLSYLKDQFAFSLGNIKALPVGLSKTSGYTVDNKYFPFLEYYTCTPEEKEALKEKIKYNGMTIGVIGKIRDYLESGALTYIQAQLIEIDIGEDYNVVTEIASELAKGVRIG